MSSLGSKENLVLVVEWDVNSAVCTRGATGRDWEKPLLPFGKVVKRLMLRGALSGLDALRARLWTSCDLRK